MYFDIPYYHTNTGWGVVPERIGGENGGIYEIKHVLIDYENDFEKVRFPRIDVDFSHSKQVLEIAIDIFSGILKIRQFTSWWWTLGMTWDYLDLRGMEDFLCDFITNLNGYLYDESIIQKAFARN